MNKTDKHNLITELLAFCAQPAIATQNIGMDEMVHLIDKKLQEIGAKTNIVKVGGSYKYILADIKARTNSDRKKTVLIYNHYDVQPTGDLKKWTNPPFEPTIKNGKVYARGIADNRGDLLSRIQAIRQMQNSGDLPVNIKWLIEGEEEIGSPNLQKLQQKYGDFWKDCDVCLWEDGRVDINNRGIVSLGMKGILYVELVCQFNKTELHSKLATVVDNPAWRLINALNTIRDNQGNVLVEGFYNSIQSPTKAEIKLLKDSLVDTNKIAGSATEKFIVNPNNKFSFLMNAYFKGTANICGIWGGFTEDNGVKTIIPNKATAKIDFRLAYGQQPDDIASKLRNHLDKRGYKDIEMKALAKLLPTKTAIENKYVQASIDSLKEVHKKDPIIDITALGGGPTYYVAEIYKIPTVEIGVGYPSCNMHGFNENIKIVDYFKTIEVLKKYLTKLADI